MGFVDSDVVFVEELQLELEPLHEPRTQHYRGIAFCFCHFCRLGGILFLNGSRISLWFPFKSFKGFHLERAHHILTQTCHLAHYPSQARRIRKGPETSHKVPRFKPKPKGTLRQFRNLVGSLNFKLFGGFSIQNVIHFLRGNQQPSKGNPLSTPIQKVDAVFCLEIHQAEPKEQDGWLKAASKFRAPKAKMGPFPGRSRCLPGS